MNWIISLIIGGIVGWLASILMKTNSQMGLVANVLVGVGGSMLGFWIAGGLGMSPTGGILRLRSRNRRCDTADLHPAHARCLSQGITRVPSEMASVQTNVDRLVRDMESAIAQADAFIAPLQEE